MSRDVLTVGSTMRIPLLYRGEYSQWVKRFLNYLEEQTDGEAMINSIKNGDQPLPRVTQVSIARTSSTEQPPFKDKSMWSDQEKKIQKIDRLARSLLIQGLSNDIYSLIDSNKTTKDLWDALARHMLGSEYVINDLKKCGYSKDNYELNFKFLNNLQPEWEQYATMMRQNKNLMDINIDALYNIIKQNQGDVNDAMGLKKKTVVVTFDPLALIAEKTKVSKRKEKVVVSLDSEGSDADDFCELKKITALLAKAINRKKFYSKPTNNNLTTSSTSQSANKKQEFVKTGDKKVEKKDDCKKVKVKDYEYYKTKMLLAKKDKDEQVLLAEVQAWMESNSNSDQEINANMVFMAQIEKVLSNSETSSSSDDDKIYAVSYYLSQSESESEYETSEYYDNTTTYGVDTLIRKFNKKIVKCLKRIEKANHQNKDFENLNKDLQDKYDVLKNQATTFETNNKELNEQLKVLIENNDDLKYAKLEAERYEYMIRYYAYFDNDKQHRKQIADQEVLYDKISVQLIELDKHVRDLKNTVLEKDFKISELEECVRNKDVEVEKCLECLNVCKNKHHKMGQKNQTVHMIMPFKDILYNGRKGIGFENLRYFEKAKDLRPSLYDEKVVGRGYIPMFLTHSDKALEIDKFKRARENTIEFAYDYGSLNASYVNEKINFLDDYFQKIINSDFDKIDSPFQQTSSLKPYVPIVILEKIIIDLEDENKKGSSNTSNVELSSDSHSQLNKYVKRYSRKDLLLCNNSHLGETSIAFVCNDAMNVSCNYRLCDLFDENNLFIFDDESVEISPVSKMPFRKKPRDSMNIVHIFLWIIDSGCSEHMTGNRALLTNFVEKFLRTVRFDGGDLLTGDRSSNLYNIALNEVALNSLTCLLAKASSSQSWLWHQRLSHLNFATINNLVKNNIVQGLPKMKFKKIIYVLLVKKGRFIRNITSPKRLFASNKPLYLLHMDLCGPMRVESINGKRYVLVVVDDYSRYTWVFFLHSKDQAFEVIIFFIKKTQVNLQLQVQRVRIDNGTEFKNKTLAKFFDEAEAIAIACFTKNRLIIHKHFDKTLYELMNKRKPNIRFFCVFGCRFYLLNDYEDVGKLKAKGDIGVFVGYSKESAAFRIYNKLTRKIHESVNVNFDEISEMASKQFSLEPGLSNLNETGQSLNPSVSQVSKTSKKDLEDIFKKNFDEYFDSSKIMKSLTTNVETSNVEIPSNKKEVFHESSESFQEESSSSSLNDDVYQSSEEVGVPSLNTQSISNNMIPNVDKASTSHNVFDERFEDAYFEASTSHNVFDERFEDAYFEASTSFHDPSNVYTFYQPYPHKKKWTKDHPLHKIIGDPKSSVRTIGQLTNSCLFSCLLSSIEPSNVAETLRDADWVSAMKEELYQFTRLKVWRLVPRPEGKSVIKTKWIFKNKKDESSLVI
nr:hypothetical protein [Tanacetum cinerariifolium]